MNYSGQGGKTSLPVIWTRSKHGRAVLWFCSYIASASIATVAASDTAQAVSNSRLVIGGLYHAARSPVA